MWLGVGVYLSMQQVADLLAVDKSTVSRWAQQGLVPTAGRVGDGRHAPVLFTATDVETFGRQLEELDGA